MSELVDIACEQPEQLEDALWRVESAGLGRVDAPAGVAVCGTGPAALGARLAAAAIGARAERPLVALGDAEPPRWVGAGWLVLCFDYAGDSDAAVAAVEAAGRGGARRVALTTGGRLAEAARAAGAPVAGVPGGLPDSAALAYVLVAALECAAASGAAPPLRGEVEAAARLGAELVREWGPGAGQDSLARDLARALAGTVPVVHGAAATAPVAARWAAQLAASAGRHALAPPPPDPDAAPWGAPGLAAVVLDDRDHDAGARRALDAVAAAAEAAGAPVRRVETRGESPVERVTSLVLLGDLVAAYAAEAA